ncbi:hypothetical protein MFIFM68171_06196 [Madurella fahalii]|uniref:Uncharacterized protein n=1 Tax=Madurella fahalii TaxID=1157608 RepID=A0ABQ0GE17_9PEZI
MQSLFTVNNNVSLISITVAPSAWVASLVLSLVFIFLYLPPLPSIRWRSLFFRRRKQQRTFSPIIEEDEGDEELLEEKPFRRRQVEDKPLPPLLTDFPQQQQTEQRF